MPDLPGRDNPVFIAIPVIMLQAGGSGAGVTNHSSSRVWRLGRMKRCGMLPDLCLRHAPEPLCLQGAGYNDALFILYSRYKYKAKDSD